MFLSVISFAASAQETLDDKAATPTGVASPRPAAPVEVKAGVHILEIGDIDFKRGTFFADFLVGLSYPETANFPGFEIANASVMDKTPLIELRRQWLTEGAAFVEYRVTARLRFNPASSDYPYDKPVLPILLNELSGEEQKVVFSPQSQGVEIEKLDAPQLQLVTVKTAGALESRVEMHGPQKSIEQKSQLKIKLYFQRLLRPWILAQLLPMAMFCFIAFLAFFIGRRHFALQATTGVLSVLGLLGLHAFQLNKSPSPAQFSYADLFFIISYATVFLALFQTFLCEHFQENGRQRLSEKLDWWAARTIPPAYILLLLLIHSTLSG
jgi:hypothetical protein